jgi:hypothetical protein
MNGELAKTLMLYKRSFLWGKETVEFGRIL